MSETTAPLIEIEGVLTGLIYHDPERGFTIAELTPEEGPAVTVVGVMPGAVEGECLRVRGRLEQHRRYGEQLKIESYELVRPATEKGIIAYLSGGLMKGIGPKLAASLVQHFGAEVLNVLDHQPQRLREVSGIGEKRATELARAWQEHKEVHRIMLFLQEHGAGATLAGRIYERYRSSAMHVLEREPYRLAREVRGIGFLTADRMARSVGIGPDDPQRLQAGIIHVLAEATGEGHFYLPQDEVLRATQQVLGSERQQVQQALLEVLGAGYVVREEASGEEGYFLPEALQAEKELAGLLLRLRDKPATGSPTEEQICAWLARRQEMGAMPLTPTQSAAVCGALRQPVTVITGGPGTGKTTITRELCDAAQALGWRVVLCGPTGRAAKRLSQLSGQPASTIHRLLSWDPSARRFRYHEAEPLAVDLLIVDETSMVDAPLARDLLRAAPAGAQVTFIGDADQLPSVGPGNFLRDLITSEAFPVVALSEVFRQAEGGQIVRYAHEIRTGTLPEMVRGTQWQGEDCVLMERETPEEAAAAVVKVVTRSLPGLGYDRRDIQVISPMHRGPAGVAALNVVLQEALNPPAPGKGELRRGEQVLRQGDRVLQTANDYDRAVFNGDVGVVQEVDREGKALVVSFDQGPVTYESSDLDQLELAYALTIHKAQGSEYPAVVMVLHSTHFIMLRRNLLYTALTRAEKLAVIVGDRKGLWKAIQTAGEGDRKTRLAARLRGELPHVPIAGRLAFDSADPAADDTKEVAPDD